MSRQKRCPFPWRQPDEEEEATGKVKEVFEDIQKTREIGHVTHPWHAMANFPDYLEMTWSWLKEIMKPGKVDALTKEIIALAVSITNGCRY